MAKMTPEAKSCKEILKPITSGMKELGFTTTWLKPQNYDRQPGVPIFCRAKYFFGIGDSSFLLAFHLMLNPETMMLRVEFQELERVGEERYMCDPIFESELTDPKTDPNKIPRMMKDHVVKFIEGKIWRSREDIIELRKEITKLNDKEQD